MLFIMTLVVKGDQSADSLNRVGRVDLCQRLLQIERFGGVVAVHEPDFSNARIITLKASYERIALTSGMYLILSESGVNVLPN